MDLESKLKCVFESVDRFLVDGGVNDYRFVRASNKNIDGVDDAADFKALTVRHS